MISLVFLLWIPQVTLEGPATYRDGVLKVVGIEVGLAPGVVFALPDTGHLTAKVRGLWVGGRLVNARILMACSVTQQGKPVVAKKTNYRGVGSGSGSPPPSWGDWSLRRKGK